ncbi:winged helix-turn-helix domain-containing protein [Ectopseudomonas hydrolytica]|uniref:winged helix-turn-helix domain-containing protein n=1 Tax=Ectopseudomonas hydrolytica TaxID=2493633 RepID=UPI003C2B451C
MHTSKTRTSFYRRLYLAWLIDSGQATSVPALMAATGMPRRTAQDTLAALEELDIDCRFEQGEGERNNAGHYLIHDWGPIDKRWIAAHLQQIKATLGYP